MKFKKITSLVLALAAAGTMCVTASAAPGDELINNGTMEGVANDNIPYYWANAGVGVTISASEERAHGGTRSLKVEGSAGSKDSGATNYFTAPTVGSVYDLTAWIYATETGTYTIAPLSGYWSTTNGSISKECQAGEWTEISGRISVNTWEPGCFRIWSETATGVYYIDDVSMVEAALGETDITDSATLETAFATGGTATVKNNFSAEGVKITVADGTGLKILGEGKTISGVSGTGFGNAIMQIGENTGASISISDMIVSGTGTFLGVNSSSATVTLDNVTFTDTSANTSALIDRTGTLKLNNVTFPARESGYDLTSEWGCGAITLSGATKLSMVKTAEYYSLDVTGLTAGADVKIAFTGEGEHGSIPYENLKSQTISEDLEMICDDDAKTIHIKTKDQTPEPTTHEEGFAFSREVTLDELNGKTFNITKSENGEEKTANVAFSTMTTGAGSAVVGIIITDIPEGVTITKVEIQ